MLDLFAIIILTPPSDKLIFSKNKLIKKTINLNNQMHVNNYRFVRDAEYDHSS